MPTDTDSTASEGLDQRFKHATAINTLSPAQQAKYVEALQYYLHARNPDLVRQLIEIKKTKRILVERMDDETFQISRNIVYLLRPG